ncbi:mRNA-decapping enzyme 1B isoform X3 [Carettochelys insculpta]|uniref:mRNA-decapping enzyme 1B isoform X3 n=1 Tax=Carettochelys insculpta TaxID=44489 RepID=UPI003EBECBBF
MAAAVAGAALLGKGLDISLAALQRQDPYISSIVDVASQVALYTFRHRANEWEKTDVEGTLFVYTRSASPRHGFTIMNRLSMENRTEPITKDLDFQLQDPFLLYRNARLSIYGIWFYDKEECQRIAELMKNLTQQEQVKARQGAGAGASPMIQSSGDSKEVDILRMLTKAKDEYTKCKTCSEPKQMTSSSAIYDNPNLIKPIPVKPSETKQQQIPHQGKNMDTEPQHLSLTALFGKQENSTTYQDVPEQSQKNHQLNLPVRQRVVRSLSYEEPSSQSSSAEKQLCPAIQKLMVRGTDLHPLSELPENRLCENGNVCSAREVFTGLFQPVTSHGIVTSHPAQDTVSTQTFFQKLQVQSGSMSKMDTSATGPVSSIASVFSRTSAATASAAQELLKKLQIVEQEQQLHVSSRPTLAAKFPVVTQNTNTLKPLDSWIDKASSAEKQTPLLQVISPQRIPATVAPALLVSPMLFTQSTPAPTKASESRCLPPATQEAAANSASLLLPMQNPEPSVINSNSLTKMQLQETLLHLIQNDENFLNIIYEAYLFSVRKAGIKKSM